MKHWPLWGLFAVLSVAALVSSLGTAFQTLSLKPGQSRSGGSRADPIPERILEAEAQAAEARGETPPLPQEGMAGFAAVFRAQMADFLERRRPAAERRNQEMRRKAQDKENGPWSEGADPSGPNAGVGKGIGI